MGTLSNVHLGLFERPKTAETTTRSGRLLVQLFGRRRAKSALLLYVSRQQRAEKATDPASASIIRTHPCGCSAGGCRVQATETEVAVPLLLSFFRVVASFPGSPLLPLRRTSWTTTAFGGWSVHRRTCVRATGRRRCRCLEAASHLHDQTPSPLPPPRRPDRVCLLHGTRDYR